MLLMTGGSHPLMHFDSRAEGIAHGRQQLIESTDQDFGYDLEAWHDYLIETGAGGYKWSNKHLGFSTAIESALADDEWRRVVALAESESLLERITERDARQRDAVDRAERQWAGQLRCCPKCGTEFKSVRDRGQCTECSYIFYASHPETGREMWWLEIT